MSHNNKLLLLGYAEIQNKGRGRSVKREVVTISGQSRKF